MLRKGKTGKECPLWVARSHGVCLFSAARLSEDRCTLMISHAVKKNQYLDIINNSKIVT